MAFRSKNRERILTGIHELDARLKGLELSVANKVSRSALSAGVRVVAKKIKAQIPSRLKGARKAIGGSVRKQKAGPNRGFTEAKAGAAVGKRKSRQQIEFQEEKGKRKAANKPGVGISSRNIHWYIQGTRARTQRTTGRLTGAMPENQVVKKAMVGAQGEVFNTIRRAGMASLERERLKLVRQYPSTWL